MKDRRIAEIAIIFICAIFTLQSCKDESNPSAPAAINLSGKLVGTYSQGIPGIEIKAGDKVTTTSADGSFSITDVNVPYSLTIKDSKQIYYFKKLSTSEILIPDFPTEIEPQTATINVTLPPAYTGAQKKIIYTDGDYVEAYSDGAPLTVKLTGNSVTGKIYVLIFSKDPDGRITSYNIFGQSENIRLNAGQTLDYTFTSQQLLFNPNDKTIQILVTPPSNYTSSNQYMTISFANKRTRNFLHDIKFEEFTGDQFYMVVPENLPVDYSILPGNLLYDNANTNRHTIEKFDIPVSITATNLLNKTPPELIVPADNQTGVELNTLFGFKAYVGESVYIIHLDNLTSGKSFSFVTDQQIFYLSDLSELGPENFINSNFSWYVEIVGPAKNVDNYLTTYTNSAGNFRGYSEGRRFSSTE